MWSNSNCLTILIVNQIVKYSRYNPTVGAGYDMALIKLKSALSFEMENVRPICLTDVEPESNVGWLIYHNTTNEKQLTMVKTQSINGIQCLEKFGTKIFNNNYMYCEDHSLCKTADGQMNNGAPIAIKVQLSDSSKYYLAAMASWPQHCDQDRDAVVGSTVDAFTKLCYKPYYQWIADTTQHWRLKLIVEVEIFWNKYTSFFGENFLKTPPTLKKFVINDACFMPNLSIFNKLIFN